MAKIRFYYNRFMGFVFYLKHDIYEWVSRHGPMIPRRKPSPPTVGMCLGCGGKFDVLSAINTGDGWLFMWECSGGCGDGLDIEWYPYWFGHYCTSDDLEQLGIDVL